MTQTTSRTALPVREAQLEAFFRKEVRRSLAGVVLKLAPTTSGAPDRLVMLPGGRMHLVELKTDTGRPRPIQVAWHQRAQQLGVHVAVLHGKDEIRGWIRRQAEEAYFISHPNVRH